MSNRALSIITVVALASGCGAEDPAPGSTIDGAGGGAASPAVGGGGLGGGSGPSGGVIGGTGGLTAGSGGWVAIAGGATGGGVAGNLGGGTGATGGAAPLAGAGGLPTGGATTGAGGALVAGTGAAGGISSTGGTSALGGSLPVGATGGAGDGATGGGAGATGGGAGATGGAMGGAPPNPYGRGYVPATVSAGDARAAYDLWKSGHLEDCGGGRYRVRWELDMLDATVSEGIGYGMLLTVSYGDRAAFDGLLAYYGAALDDHGLMHWLRYGCDAHPDVKYSEYPDGAAADADLDVAMSLIMAGCRWGDAGYRTEAARIITAIKTHMFWEDGGLRVLQPGDSDWFDTFGAGCVNYSYFSPAYYRAFAEVVPADAAFWNGAASDAYTLLARASHTSTGLVRNWGAASGGDASCGSSYNRPNSYGPDAARTPWRVGVDYLWNGTAEAKTWADKVTSWVSSIGIANAGLWYNLDGTLDPQGAADYAEHSAINVGPFAVGAMTFDQATADRFGAELLNIPPTGPREGDYFSLMLRAVSLLTLAGGFTQCGGG